MGSACDMMGIRHDVRFLCSTGENLGQRWLSIVADSQDPEPIGKGFGLFDGHQILAEGKCLNAGSRHSQRY